MGSYPENAGDLYLDTWLTLLRHNMPLTRFRQYSVRQAKDRHQCLSLVFELDQETPLQVLKGSCIVVTHQKTFMIGFKKGFFYLVDAHARDFDGYAIQAQQDPLALCQWGSWEVISQQLRIPFEHTILHTGNRY